MATTTWLACLPRAITWMTAYRARVNVSFKDEK
jgi:hypothetical protein